MRIAAVLLPLPVPEAFDYAVPDGMALAAGDHVHVPLGPRLVRGVVSEVREQTGSNRRLKAVAERLDETPLPPSSLEFLEWAARWTLTPPGEMALLAWRGLRHGAPRAERIIRRVGGRQPARMTPARQAVLEAVGAGASTAVELARRAGVSTGVVKGLIDEGVLESALVPPPQPQQPDPDRPGAALNPAQAAAADAVARRIEDRAFRPILLDGVTGSGKTEVYLEAAARLLKAEPGAQVLILLPEIALTQAVIGRVAARFGATPGEWHSGVPGPQRRLLWEAVASGEQKIVVGARSALFLPFKRLRLIVVDEEHDASFKQEEGLIYHARDLAVARARIEGCVALLASATPSLETLWNAESGRYDWLRLSARHGVARLPAMRLIDMRSDGPERGRWLSPALVEAMGETFAAGEQTLLFLNRRGYAPVVLCRACGQRLTAPDTDSWLVEHRYTGRLVCHLTGFSMPRPRHCPHCGAEDSLVSVGPGVERIEEEVAERFPEARTAVFSSDTAPDGAAARQLVERMARGEIDVLVATQAAAKGHNFPNLTLVGVVDADLGLRGGDLRAGERTFQLLAQAAGRAGRADKPGRALIQTFMPEHPVMQALEHLDRDAFIEAEMAERAQARMPPHGRLAALVLSSENPQALEETCRQLAAQALNAEGAEIYGPADAPLALVRGRRRKRFLVRADRTVDVQALVREWLSRVKIPASVRLNVDVDPYSFL
ncbi:primosomal protein N' [Brevundimonas sp. 2R-24]|uniref:Replication restart protein PriA n=1 Tax=Peiella sedimenti TaxID=3061083 RepID=A0ABT8SMR7_9CAUL|nr:primosomal protein N' [Caulobacteraceae bacterium XZ-24]